MNQPQPQPEPCPAEEQDCEPIYHVYVADDFPPPPSNPEPIVTTPPTSIPNAVQNGQLPETGAGGILLMTAIALAFMAAGARLCWVTR